MNITRQTDSQDCLNKLISECVGKPWSVMGRGPESFDCWGFVRHVLKNGFGFDAPDWLYESGPEVRPALFETGRTSPGWYQLDSFKPYCIVLIGQSDKITHVGIYHPDNMIFHSLESKGVVGTTIKAMKRLGFGLLIPYAHKEMEWLT